MVGGSGIDGESVAGMRLEESVASLTVSSIPGLLTLCPSRAEVLVAREPLHQLYTVENQPFARGKFAAVKRCRNILTGEQFAAKVIRKRRRGGGLTPESLHEAATLDLCRSCPHIVRLEQVYDTPGETVLILQLATGGELQSVLDRDEIPEEKDVIRFLRQVLSGLLFLHQYDIAHLDLKPQNLLLTGPFPDCDIKLCDFGIARHIARGADVREILGTPDYVAPEILNYEPISLATDMWSVGVLAYVLLTGCTPFGGETKQETFCNITRCQLDFPSDLFDDVSATAIDFISSLLTQDPSIRLTAQRCLDHPWLRVGSSIDKIPSFLQFCEDSSTLSCNSTIVPDDEDLGDDQTDAGSVFQDTLDETVVDGQSDPLAGVGSPANAVPLATASTQLVAFPTRTDINKPQLCAVSEDSCFTSYPISRRGNSLPFRLRAPTNRRETSCDRTSDLGYGSDGVSEISSADSSSDRSSIISLDDTPSEWTQPALRRYSDTSHAAQRLWRRTWERFLPATAGTCAGLPRHLFSQDCEHHAASNDQEAANYRPWERVCTGSRARALERFNTSPPSSTVDLSKSLHSLSSSLPVRPAIKVPEVRTRLLKGPTCTVKSSPLPTKASLVHLDKAETVRSRVVKFQSVTNSPTTS
ncbi:serine/threonine-protein kinase 17B-like [Daphnia carinata]|uniref:serine/threonine-protein kinase 17B-like n=1 Tax=Daphnia carinata TaxID=120202 RepID=UPI00257CBC87|nr:serine/threonine-protein kinase 17B-like [Daphnia carinata]